MWQWTAAPARDQVNVGCQASKPVARSALAMAGTHQSLRGRLLLDGGSLHGSWFHRTVVLICQHDPEGAFGLVLNRPSGTRLVEAVTSDVPEHLSDAPLFIGGPVQPGALSYLRSETYLPDGSVMANVDLGHSLDELIELTKDFSAGRRFLVFAGYAGWSPGQLDDEIARQSWLVHPATPEMIFSAHPDRLWREILREMGGLYRILAESPEDPDAN